MSSIYIKEIETTIKIDRNAAQLLTKALVAYADKLTEDEPSCECEFCTDPTQRAKKIRGLYFEAYPLSKVAKHAIGIPSLQEIEDRIARNNKED